LTLTAIREIQKKGGVAAFIDAEHAFDPTYAKIIGVNLDDLLISQRIPGAGMEIAETLVRSNAGPGSGGFGRGSDPRRRSRGIWEIRIWDCRRA
jgi:RecA/RadA recombinase